VHLDEIYPFPLLALVGQPELKTALILTLINPQIGGVLVSGPYGVGKTTAVRGLLDILPIVDGEENSTGREQMRLIELPLNARLEDVIGGINERVAIEQSRVQIEEGVLVRAHRNVLYVDEINLLEPAVIDAILDAAAQGRTMVRRGPVTRLYPTRFVLIGSMNPEEGELRPQIMDRFGLRVWVTPLSDSRERLEIYRRTHAFRTDPVLFRNSYAAQTAALAEEVEAAREILPHVTVPPLVEELALALVQSLQVPSHRAEIALIEAARARAASDFRNVVNETDIRKIAPLALRQRRSVQIEAYASKVAAEDSMIDTAFQQLIKATTEPEPTKDSVRTHTPRPRSRRSDAPE
jgi:magnesium chelatase subunit I